VIDLPLSKNNNYKLIKFNAVELLNSKFELTIFINEHGTLDSSLKLDDVTS